MRGARMTASRVMADCLRCLAVLKARAERTRGVDEKNGRRA